MNSSYPPYPTFRYWLYNNFAGISIGDVKDGFLPSDHNGWIILDGRLTTELTVTQKMNATALGFTTNLPNADNSFTVQNGDTLGVATGSNGKLISQTHLPNIQLGGTTTADTIASEFSSKLGTDLDTYTNGDVINFPATPLIQNHGSHSHAITTDYLSGGMASQVTFDVTPRSLSVNKFVYLGQ